LRQKTEDQSAQCKAKWLARLAPGRLRGVSPREFCPDPSTPESPHLFRRACTWIAEKRLIERGIGLTVIATFIGSTYVYLRNYRRYSQVESWPSVPATVQSLASYSGSTPYYSRQGSSTLHSTFTDVRFTYTVGGVTHQGTRPSPDDEIPILGTFSIDGGQPRVPEPRAYYLPSDPSIAVLYPLPYQGFGLLAAAIVSGALLGLYGFFSLRL
jgi:hypothetical protein